MNSTLLRLLLSLFALTIPFATRAAVINSDTVIGPNDTSYDGQDIVVSNAVLTVDGSHTFNSLRVAAGATLTHSAPPGGSIPFIALANELYQLSDTNPVTLLQSEVFLHTLVVTDTNGIVTYTNEMDYVVTNVGGSFTLRRTTNSLIADGGTVFVSYEYQSTTMAGLIVTVTTDLEIESGGGVDANGRGFVGGAGTGAGGSAGSPLSGGGGGHGGYGGFSSSNAAGGLAYGGTFAASTCGSGGGAGTGGSGGSGGGLVLLWVGGNCVLDGSITADGQNATNSRAGGGAGGGISITALAISGVGTVSVRGGAGEPSHGGGGGGGRIALVAETNSFAGLVSATGGAGWQRGGAGTLFVTNNGSPGKVTIDNGGFSGAATPVALSVGAPDVEVRGRAAVVTTASSLQTTRDLLVRSNSTISTLSTVNASLNMLVTGDAVIERGAVLSVLGKGYATDQGPGVDLRGPAGVGGGAGHGGYGGSGVSSSGTVASGGNAYDSVTSPTQSGSGGRTAGSFPGGAGGGAVRLNVMGKLQLDGKILVDGTDGSGTASGGASGGSVWLTVGGFSGGGHVSANGGSGGVPFGGGGGGGRIAVTYNSNSFTGTLTAFGGAGAVAGGAGTIYTKQNLSSYADVRVDNGGLSGTNTPLDNLSPLSQLIISGGALVRPGSSSLSLETLTVASNSTLLLGNGSSSVNVTVSGNVTVAAGGRISGDGLGHSPFSGPGSGRYALTGSSGGGHGGYGGRGAGVTIGGNAYDSTSNPSQAGSGGGDRVSPIGGAGGAAIRLTVNGTLVLDGRLSANGISPSTNNSGGGAGGSFWLTLNRFSGSGQISADGGNGFLPNGGGGGGGRIAVYWNSNSFMGTYSAKGGNGFVPGGAGTIYLKANNAPAPSLILDNGGRLGGNTALDVLPLFNLTLSSGARVTMGGNFAPSSGLNITNLYIADKATLYFINGGLSVGSATIAAGGAIIADGVTSSGNGTGGSSGGITGSGGGGYGGYGGRGAGTGAGGNAYELAGAPATGSPGGGISTTFGLGGGRLSLNVGLLVLDGRISANGSNAITNGSGGGSGGNLMLTFNRLSGSGVISADGGNGHLPNGGGGGGGRISIVGASNLFAGTISAKGGLGFVAGGAGVIQLRQFSSALPIVIADNGGMLGANTLLVGGLSSLLELNVRSGAIANSPATSLTMSNLNIEANAALQVSTMTLTVSGTANIAAGGSINADGGGTQSSGSGSPSGSAGAGHGGQGGRGAGVTTGGASYDSTASPTQAGQAGRGFTTTGLGLGGGALRMIVSGPMILDGKISANGLGASTNNGGGSGGSLWLTLNQFSGSGDLSVNGGAGHLPNGGGGGGGRIAVYWNSNVFTGTYSAKGGNGFQAGGAGTIYLRPNNSQTPSLLVDNGGLLGTNTSFDLVTLSNLTIRGGAVLRAMSASTISLGSLNIASNSTLLAPPNNGTLTLSLSGPAIVEEGGSISADAQGFPSGTGTFDGAGISAAGGSGGGGHAGYGGRGVGNASTGGNGLGGNAYDSLISPALGGSGGGGFNSAGGAGGGVIRITTIRAPFTLNGRISANGINASSNNAGGGAGGSISLNLDGLIGRGSISADGGHGHLPNGGGGGGGRVQVDYDYVGTGNGPFTNGFLGTFSAKGGNGFVAGGAGTIYARTSNVAQAWVDNGGVRGTNTLVFPNFTTSSYDLTVSGGAVATSLGQPRDLFVRSNGWLTALPLSQGFPPFINISRNATFDAGGGIDLDGLGTGTTGSGSTSTTPKGGGGHGGYGALNSSGKGNAYSSAITPIQGGSAGGNGSGSAGLSPFGGAGGGVAKLTVGSTLTVNGELSADGRAGEFNSGGGSGGGLWLEATTLAGNGRITAQGGDGNGTAGGGGGGRVAIYYRTNLFTGEVSACGGDGALAGGAGTMFWRNTTAQLTSLVLDNCGLVGANTPLSQSIGFATNLTVTGGAIAEMQGMIPAFSNLVIEADGWVTPRTADTNLYLVLFGNLAVAEGGGIFADGKGFARGVGPGAGGTLDEQGAGGSYGGWGGDSLSGAFSGPDYGSATKPVERGSGGGAGSGPPSNGSEGGGAIRLAVAGTLALDGFISADGNHGFQDNSGGGSGGSVWISAKTFTGSGIVSAGGGDGEFYAGGGGGGGRIAIYSPTNTYTGSVSVAGGDGAFAGGAGTIFRSSILNDFEVLSQSPTGLVADAVSQVLLEFSEPINPMSVTAGDVKLYTPIGLLAQSNLTITVPSPATLRLAFPPQNIAGDFRIEVGPLIEGLLAARMSQIYTGAFSAAPPLLRGTVTDTNSQPVAGVTLHASGGLMPTTTDVNGNYSLGVPANWSGSVTPAFGNFMFAPGTRSYASVSGDVTNQNYQMVSTIAAELRVGGGGGAFSLNWDGLSGVSYQLYWSTNLTEAAWYPLDSPLAGTNGVMELQIPISDEPEKYFRLNAQN